MARGPHEARQQCFCGPRYTFKILKVLNISTKKLDFLLFLLTIAPRKAIFSLSAARGTFFPEMWPSSAFEFETPAPHLSFQVTYLCAIVTKKPLTPTAQVNDVINGIPIDKCIPDPKF